MNDKEFIAALKDMDNDTLIDNLEDLGGDKYYQELRFAIIAEIRKRLAVPEREKGTKDCRDCVEWKTCPCGEEGHTKGTSIGYSIGECKDFKSAEREKGEWIESTYQFCGRTFSCIRCSNCDNPQDYFRTTHFCPNCGADMRG